MAEKQNTPEIRFEGFTDPWEQRKFSDLVLIERGGSPRPIDAYITEDPAGLNWVKIGDAPSMGRYITTTSEKIKPEGLSKTRQVYPGDLVLSNSMSFGRPYIMAVEGCIHDGWLLIRDTQNQFDPVFLCHMLGTPQMLDQYRMFASGSTVNNLNKELVGNAMVPLPDRDEQVKIGNYLDELDGLITLHQRKHDKLCTLKKSMLDKMFPKPGETEPEIRFEGFTDPWEQRKWSEYVSISTDMVDPRSGNYDNLPHVGPGNMESFTGRLYDNVNTVKDDALISGKFHFNPGDIIYGKINPQLGKYTYAQFEGLASADAYVLNGKNGLTQEFLFGILQTKAFFDYSVSVSMRSGMPKINRDELNAFEFLAPNESEQRAIGDILLKLDDLITLHQRKLELLRNIKKSLLDRMFV